MVSTVTGTHTDGSPVGGQPAYVDVAVKNVGTGAAGWFFVQLEVDGTVSSSWSVPNLAAGATWTVGDSTLTLAAGSHTLRLVADCFDAVTESSETNNSTSRTYVWQGGNHAEPLHSPPKQ